MLVGTSQQQQQVTRSGSGQSINFLGGGGLQFVPPNQAAPACSRAAPRLTKMETGISERGAPGPFLNLCWEKTSARKVTQDFAFEATSSYFRRECNWEDETRSIYNAFLGL